MKLRLLRSDYKSYAGNKVETYDWKGQLSTLGLFDVYRPLSVFLRQRDRLS